MKAADEDKVFFEELSAFGDGIVAYWWIQEVGRRMRSFSRLQKAGKIRIEIMGYPNWKITRIEK